MTSREWTSKQHPGIAFSASYSHEQRGEIWCANASASDGRRFFASVNRDAHGGHRAEVEAALALSLVARLEEYEASIRADDPMASKEIRLDQNAPRRSAPRGGVIGKREGYRP